MSTGDPDDLAGRLAATTCLGQGTWHLTIWARGPPLRASWGEGWLSGERGLGRGVRSATASRPAGQVRCGGRAEGGGGGRRVGSVGRGAVGGQSFGSAFYMGPDVGRARAWWLWNRYWPGLHHEAGHTRGFRHADDGNRDQQQDLGGRAGRCYHPRHLCYFQFPAAGSGLFEIHGLFLNDLQHTAISRRISHCVSSWKKKKKKHMTTRGDFGLPLFAEEARRKKENSWVPNQKADNYLNFGSAASSRRL